MIFTIFRYTLLFFIDAAIAASGARSHGTRGEQPEWLKAVVVEGVLYHHCSAARVLSFKAAFNKMRETKGVGEVFICSTVQVD